ncbi:MAG: amino acid adenylation domain-containing protein [Acidimicrobiales bacterium]|nr:MAG: amino acid adenylation domain-containing protein [Acidimicrobiales bacterium]
MADHPVRLRPRNELTASQQLIWTSQRLNPDVPLANMATVSRIDALLDPQRFVDAVNAVVAGSDALRLAVIEVDGAPHPSTHDAPTSATTVIEMAHEELDAWMADRIATPIDVGTSVYDSVLIKHQADSWSWWMNIHHIGTDASSTALIFQGVAAAYDGTWEPGSSYEDLARDLAAQTETPRWQKARDYWQDASHDLSATEFYVPDGELTTRAERRWVEMTPARQQQLDQLLADRFRLLSPDLSLTAVLLTVIASYVSRLNGSEELAVGLPIHHRGTADAKTVIGPVVELFPVSIRIEPDDTFATLQKRIASSVFTTLTNAQPGASPRQSFDVVLNVHGATFGTFGTRPTATRWIHPGHIDAHHRLRVQALDYDGTGELELALDINHAIADADHRRRAPVHFGKMLDALLVDPDQPIRTIDLIADDERLLLAPLTTPEPGTPLDAPVAELIERQLQRNPEQLAVRCRAQELTAAELNRAIAGAAAGLRQAGIGPGSRVGIEMPIGVDALVAIHGALRAGASFVPIDPSYPEGRRSHIRADAGLALVLTGLHEIDELEPRTSSVPPPLPAETTLDHEAYVIYTSGSTGLPKGVPISQRGLAEYLGFAIGAYVGDEPPVMALYTSLSFDLTITTLFLPLLVGGRVTIHPDGGLPALREIVDEGEVTLLKATPSHLELLVRMIDESHPLAGLIVGGEAFYTDLADRLLAASRPGLRIFNEYGPTEAVVGCMVHEYDPEVDVGAEVPIGRPAPGVALHVLDAVGSPVPLGVVGELFIHRPGMTTGYLERPDLNAEKFVPHSGGVLYRSGDLVRMLDAERMVYLGRADQQIKVRGVRLEPGEIEAVAQSVAGVDRAVAALWTPQSHAGPRLCVRCGLGDDVPDIVVDADGVCSACHAYELVAPQAAEWFRTEDDLRAELQRARDASTGDYDVLHLLSGGKDSTYALYRLVELGARVMAVTLDNGFISDGAKDNVRRATQALGADHEFVTVDAMNEIFRDSLSRFSNVCNGCYKAIYTIALQRAEKLGIPAIVTGLSRGQFFETRLVPGMFGADRFDADAIDAAVIEARRAYHHTPDAVSENMDTSVLDDDTLFERVRFIDFYRYVDVALSDMYDTLESSGTWERPADTGRSTNCLINAAGIFVHKIEQGHHNYALPYSWDVRLGHKTRAEAMEELDDPMDDVELAAITSMLADVGYEPRRPEVLTLWVAGDEGLDVEGLQRVLDDELPEHARPQAVEVVPRIPLTVNGKVDMANLPAPSARRRSESVVPGRLPTTSMEQRIAPIWADVLSLSEVSVTDDFFALGGTSLHALEMIVRVSEMLDQAVPEAYAFRYRTLAELADAIDGTDADTAGPTLAIPELPEDERPLSAGESAMLFEWRNDPDDVRYNVARLYDLPATTDVVELRRALETAVAHQPTLHTSYGADRRTLAVSEALRFEHRHSSQPIAVTATQLNTTTFDLVNGPLVSAHVLSSSVEGGTSLLLRTHHISSDAGSLDVLWDQIDLAYRNERLPALRTSYAAHGEWQREQRPVAADLWDPPPIVGSLALRSSRSTLADGYVEQVATVGASELRAAPGTTPFATALAALTAALAPFHDGPQFEIAVTSSVRDHPDLSDVVGYFLNPLPLIVQGPDASSLRTVAEQTSELLVDALHYRSVPFAEVIRSARERDVPEPESKIMLAVEDLAPARFDGSEIGHQILASGTAVNDLTFFVQLRGEHIDIGCEYRGSVVDEHEASQLLARFDRALGAMVEAPDDTVGSLKRSGSLLVGAALDATALVPGLISASVARHPDEPAVRFSDQKQSYADLDLRARSIAARLRVAGVGVGDRVAIVLPRGIDLPASIMATWMLGASYVPIDTIHPAARVSALAAAAGIKAAVTNAVGHPGLGDVLTIDIDRSDAAVLPITRVHDAAETDEAYVIFTSGSTGQPKGVPITQGNLAASLSARHTWYDAPVQRYLLLSNAGFDSSVAGLFWTLADAGELIIPAEDQIHDVDALLDLIERTAPTHTLCVPSLYGAMLTRSRQQLSSFEVIIVAGEACPPELIERHFRSQAVASLINEYGPTEATVWATATELGRDQVGAAVSIGGPIPGVTARVVHGNNDVVPLDVAGELLISGPTVAAGYVDGTDDTDAFFIDDVHGPTYRTGDNVVARASGELEFLGRIDDQLSIGGVRIEPAEVEHALASLEGVTAAVADELDGRLVAWVETAADVDGRVLRDRATVRLPATHIPSRVIVADRLPRTANGKIDRAQLHTIDDHEPRSAEVLTDATVSPELAAMLNVWTSAFHGLDVSADDDFFALGGDSLRAVELVTEIEDRLGVRVPIGQLVDAPTPRLLARQLYATGATRRSSGLVEWLRSTGDQTPLIVLPPGGGNLIRYAPLVGALDRDVPVLGLRLPGADARSPIEETIEAQARVMLDALDNAYSFGPYRLLGWSTGGLIAWEIARLLSERGDEVELVALVDTVMGGMHVEEPQSPVDKYRSLLQDDGLANVASEAARRLRERTEFAVARRRYRKTREQGGVPALADAERQLGPVIRRASLGYEPPPLEVRTLYFAATESGVELTVDPWRSLVPQLDVVTIEGVHYLPDERCIIGPNKVGELVEALSARL